MSMMPDNRTIAETNIDEIIEETIEKKNVILDSQILSALMACPRLSDFKFNLNLVAIGGKSNSIECGSIVHAFLENYYKSQIQGLDRDKAFGFGMAAAEMYIRGCEYCTDFEPHDCKNCDGSGKIASDSISDNMIIDVRTCDVCNGNGRIEKPVCRHQINQYPGVKNTPREPDLQNPQEKYKTGWQWVLETCEQYHQYYRNDFWVPLDTEVVKAQVIYEDDEVRVMWKSKLDIIWDTNDGIYNGDHKTAKQNRDTLVLNNQFIGQTVVMGTNRVYINKVGFQKTLKPAEKFIRPPLYYSDKMKLEWVGTIVPYYAKLLIMYAETGYFPPNWQSCEQKYGKCNFYDVCKADPHMREDELKAAFVIGPEWNPTNDTDED